MHINISTISGINDTVYTCKKSYVSTMWLLQEGM